MAKVLTVIGARPQFIKASAVSRAMANSNILDEVILHTGQHFDAKMSQIFFDEMGIPKPAYNLNINNASHAAMTAAMMTGIEQVVFDERPDYVLVYGDTNSTLAGALVAAKLHIPVIHVEAGLRSGNMNMPEEVNRILTDRVSSLLFCTSQHGIDNLNKEGFGQFNSRIVAVGDVMMDSALYYGQAVSHQCFDYPDNFILLTLHRAENTDDPARLSALISAINRISERIAVVVPLHPRTQGAMVKHGLTFAQNVKVVNPVGYLEMLWLIQHSRLVMTDSGGLQKDAYYFQKYCVTLRDETEWVELVEHGCNVLTGATAELIESSVNVCIDKKWDNAIPQDLYGNGHAAQLLVENIVGHYTGSV
jgi:UDP-GlcNAc3NAcA epimerase